MSLQHNTLQFDESKNQKFFLNFYNIMSSCLLEEQVWANVILTTTSYSKFNLQL